MKSIGKKIKGYFSMFVVQFSSGYIIVQGGLLYWLVSLIQIGMVTLMIRSLLQVMFSALVQDLSLGPVRNNRLLHFLQ
jgi:mannitol-specific phosphotransferase system IIBC component